MSSSSSGTAVSVSKSSRSWSPGPPSRAGTRPQWCRALSMMPAKSHSARAGGFGRSARVMAALRRKRAICISCFPFAMKGFRRQMLPVSARDDVCRVLKRSRDGWMPPRPLFTQAGGGEYPVASILRFHFCHATVYDRMPPVQHLRERPLQWRRPHTRPGPHCVQGQHSENISGPGSRSGASPAFRGNARVCQLHAADNDVNARVVLPRGFCCAAGFCVLQLRVQKGAAAPTLATSHPDSVTESILNVVKVSRHFPRTRPGGKATCGRPERAQVFNPGYLLPGTLLEESRESCAWSCGALSRLFPGLRSPCHRCPRLGRRSLGVQGMRWSGLRRLVRAVSQLFAAKHRLPPGLPSEMASERRVSRIRSGRRLAQTGSRIIP